MHIFSSRPTRVSNFIHFEKPNLFSKCTYVSVTIPINISHSNKSSNLKYPRGNRTSTLVLQSIHYFNYIPTSCVQPLHRDSQHSPGSSNKRPSLKLSTNCTIMYTISLDTAATHRHTTKVTHESLCDTNCGTLVRQSKGDGRFRTAAHT